jgi:hypothetical protein
LDLFLIGVVFEQELNGKLVEIVKGDVVVDDIVDGMKSAEVGLELVEALLLSYKGNIHVFFK